MSAMSKMSKMSRMRLARPALASLLVLVLAIRAFAIDPPQGGQAGDPLEQALAAYRSAQETSAAADRPAAFARAERLFAAAASTGSAGPELWTNVGTAALQAEHLGTAILAYRRALALDPDHRHAQQNLAHARTLLPPWVPRPETSGFLDSFLAWQHAMSPGERRGGAAVAFLLAASLLGAALATRSGALRLLSALVMVVWGLLLASDVLARSERGGVLTAADTVARAADSRNAPARFAEPLPAGTEVEIAEVRGEWARIVLANGRDAWVAASSVEPVEPDAART
jgi:tetratricopeptide (TPR) repeat protein